MRRRSSWFRVAPGWPVHLIAVGSTVLAISHVLVSDHRLDETLIEVGITLVLVLGFVFVGIRFARAALLPHGRTRIFAGTVLFGTIVTTLVAVLIAVRTLGSPVRSRPAARSTRKSATGAGQRRPGGRGPSEGRPSIATTNRITRSPRARAGHRRRAR